MKRARHQGAYLNFHSLLNDNHIHRRRPLLALLNIGGHPISLLERFEPRFLDAGMMNEYIRAVFLFDEAVSFIIDEPFDNTVSRGGDLPTGINSEAGFCAQKGQNWIHGLEIGLET